MSRFRGTAPPPSPHDLNPRRDPPLDFPVRALGELGPADYDALGFLCGLEVHQQLLTDRKLFCRCPAGRRSTRVDMEVLRHMRPTLSEMGQYDGCALMEFKTKKEIVYLLERDSVCTYEMDDTPPFAIDEQAVKVALEVSSLLGLNLVSELHVMRKQYLDGSIPTGFQRTAMVGIDGAIPFSSSELGADRMLRVRQLTLEEDSCREVSDEGHRITFRTDRLGTPLIETVTEPDLLTPRDAAAGGRLLAEVARASGKVRRGAGAARQDVNVSVAGGRRIEIKGVPSHRAIPLLVHTEAYRQLELLRIRDALARRGASRDALSLGDVEWAWESPLVEVRDQRDGERTALVRLPGFEGLLSHRTQPGLDLLHEFAERVRVIACLDARAVRADDAAGTVSVSGPDDDVDTAVREIVLRAREAFDGVPSETRQARARRHHRLRAHPARRRSHVSRHGHAARADPGRVAARDRGAPARAPVGSRAARAVASRRRRARSRSGAREGARARLAPGSRRTGNPASPALARPARLRARAGAAARARGRDARRRRRRAISSARIWTRASRR